jgi:ribosomal protein S18 acetylase RimI-like enzyme
MKAADLNRISGLDRSEHVTLAYEVSDGKLTQLEVDWDVPAWFVDGDGDHSLSDQIAFWRSHLDQGGVMLGAFKDDLIVGAAIVRPVLRDDLAQLAFLHVSRRFRRQGIARRLMRKACEIAHEAGSRRMYASSIPSSSAVSFYIDQGYKLSEEVDPELYALEPEDIHLILDL